MARWWLKTPTIAGDRQMSINCPKCKQPVTANQRFKVFKDWQDGQVVEHVDCTDPTKGSHSVTAGGIVTSSGERLGAMKKHIA